MKQGVIFYNRALTIVFYYTNYHFQYLANYLVTMIFYLDKFWADKTFFQITKK